MYVFDYGNNSPVLPPGFVPNPSQASSQGHTINPAFVPPPGFIATNVPSPAPALAPSPAPGHVASPVPYTPRHTPTPPVPVHNAVQVPAGCYPIELVQFWRSEYKRGNPFPLHWALFVRTVPPGSSHPSGTLPQGPRGNFYELVGSPETYTAQFLAGVTFSPETLPDWRGTHVIGWVHPAQLGVFERVVRQVPVWRGRADWRCQQWVYEVVCALGNGKRRYEGVYVEGCTLAGMQRDMGWLLDAWENGDI